MFEHVKSVSENDVQKVLEEKEKILEMSAKGMLKEVQNYIQAFYKLLTDPNAQSVHKAIAVVALLYMISPIDIIPDVFVGVGYLDDIAIILTAVSLIGKLAIEAYYDSDKKYKELKKKWKSEDQSEVRSRLDSVPLILKIAENKSSDEICEYIENDHVRYWQVSQDLLSQYNIKTIDQKIFKPDALYIRHPYIRNQLLELDGLDDYIANQKRVEYKLLASSLGAQSIFIEDRIIIAEKSSLSIDAKIVGKVNFDTTCDLKNVTVKSTSESQDFFASPIDNEMAILDRLLWIYEEPDKAKNLCYQRLISDMKSESCESTYFSEKYFSVKSKVKLQEILSQMNAHFQSTNSMAIRSKQTFVYEQIDLSKECRQEIYDKISSRIDNRIKEIKLQQY
jgi:uncharacterized membrane protein YkvA (DUF1232 family)